MRYLRYTPISCGERPRRMNLDDRFQMPRKNTTKGVLQILLLACFLLVGQGMVVTPALAGAAEAQSDNIRTEWRMESAGDWLHGASLWVVVKIRYAGRHSALGPSSAVLFPSANPGFEFKLLEGERVVAHVRKAAERGFLSGSHSHDNVDIYSENWLRFLVRLMPLATPVPEGEYRLSIRLGHRLFGYFMHEHDPPPWLETTVRIVKPSSEEARALLAHDLNTSEWIVGPPIEVADASDRLRKAVEFDKLMRFLAASPVDLSLAALPALSVAGNEFFAPELEAIAFELAGHDPSAESPERERLVGHGLRWLLSSLRYFHGRGIVSDAREWNRALLRQVERRKRGVRQPAGGEQGEPSSSGR